MVGEAMVAEGMVESRELSYRFPLEITVVGWVSVTGAVGNELGIRVLSLHILSNKEGVLSQHV
jgi:hypothetical protein